MYAININNLHNKDHNGHSTEKDFDIPGKSCHLYCSSPNINMAFGQTVCHYYNVPFKPNHI